MKRLLLSVFAALALSAPAQAVENSTYNTVPATVAPRGLTGPAGCSLLPTSGAPALTVGKVCDMAIDASAGVWYGPKTASGWPSGLHLAYATQSQQNATAAAQSAANAATSANAAATSAGAAFNDQAGAGSLLQQFLRSYLGAFPTDAAANAFATTESVTLQTGQLYENTGEGKFRVYSGAAWGDYDASAQAAASAAANSATAAATSASGSLSKASNLSDLPNPGIGRTSLGLAQSAHAFRISEGSGASDNVFAFTNACVPVGQTGADPLCETLSGDVSMSAAGVVTVNKIGGVPVSGATVPAPQGRLTLTSGSPVMSSNVSAAPTVYYTPYAGSTIPIWNGSVFVGMQFSQLSNVLANSATGNAGPAAAAASGLYDFFVWNNGGTLTLTRGPAWTSANARSLSISRVNGVLTNASAITNGPAAGYGTYVGTGATDASGGTITWNMGSPASGGGAAFLDVWNEYNRINVVADVVDSGGTYTYATAGWREVRGSTTDQVSFVVGVSEDQIFASYGTTATTSGTVGSTNIFSVGLNSTTAPLSPQFTLVAQIASTTLGLSGSTSYAVSPLTGSNYLAACEFGTSPSNTLNPNQNSTLLATLRM